MCADHIMTVEKGNQLLIYWQVAAARKWTTHAGCLQIVYLIITPPFQIIGRLTFLIPSLTPHIIKKFMQNITSFVVGCFINTRSSRIT